MMRWYSYQVVILSNEFLQNKLKKLLTLIFGTVMILKSPKRDDDMNIEN